jgi:GT2 family glycosyltransferase
MQLSVIILNYNVRFFLEQCIHSVQKATKNLKAEIIVVDNNSQDESCSMVKQRFPEVILIENKENLGFPKGNNVGVAAAKGDYVCILNPDTVVEEDTFIKILDFAQKQKNLGIIGARLIDGTGNFLPESKRGVPTPWVAFTKISGLYKKFPKVERFTRYYASHLNENQTGKVSVLVGAFMVMKRQVYLDLEGFDENCFMYSDDIDLSYKSLLAGLDNFYFADTTVIHYKGESTVKDALYVKRFQEAMEFFYQKHFKKSALFSIFMKIGASIFVKNKAQVEVKVHKKIDHYLFLSNNPEFGKLIEHRTIKNVKVFDSIENLRSATNNKKPNQQVEIVFDVQSFNYSDIFLIMRELSDKGFTFKMLSNNQKFIIGSDSSDGRGEVVDL